MKEALGFRQGKFASLILGGGMVGVATALHFNAFLVLSLPLLFAAGIMSLVWMAAITAFVFIEKLFPAGQWIARAGGVAMLGFGGYLICQA